MGTRLGQAISVTGRSSRFKSYIGRRIGRLIVESFLGYGGHNRQYKRLGLWKCQCDCGNIQICVTSDLSRELVKSCGCLIREHAKRQFPVGHKLTVTHGLSKSSTYTTWQSMKARCNNPSHNSYSEYGGRGIKICPEWESSFETFLTDLGERPLGTTIDRIDGNLGYFPGNCRWATPTQQAANRRSPLKAKKS